MPQVLESDDRAIWCRVVRKRYLKSGVGLDGNKTLGGLGAHNVATFAWEKNDGTKMLTTRPSEDGHSEKEIWEVIKAECKAIDWIYTEREPCGGCTKGCSKWLLDTKIVDGPAHRLAPGFAVYWTWPCVNPDLSSFESSKLYYNNIKMTDDFPNRITALRQSSKVGMMVDYLVDGKNEVDKPGKYINNEINKRIVVSNQKIRDAYHVPSYVKNPLKADMKAAKSRMKQAAGVLDGNVDLGFDPRPDGSKW